MAQFSNIITEQRYLEDLHARGVDTSCYAIMRKWHLDPLKVGVIHDAPWLSVQLDALFSALTAAGWNGELSRIKTKFGYLCLDFDDPECCRPGRCADLISGLYAQTAKSCWTCGAPSIKPSVHNACREHQKYRGP